MADAAVLAFTILGIAVVVHIILVNITLGSGWISAMARFLAWRRKSPDLEVMSRRVFKILIIHELFSGVWGTVITVILAGFFPTLTAIATDLIFYPILIALTSIFIRIPTIALFWYTWGKVRSSVHSLIGLVMAISGFGVPFGFRYIFAETSYPYALSLASQGLGDVARFAVFFNPVYLPLLLHTWVGAMSIGGFIVASFFAIRRNVNVKFAWIGLWHGVLFLGIQGVIGPTYLLTLFTKVPLLYDNILGAAGGTLNLSPIFGVKLALIIALAGLSALTWRQLKRGNGVVPKYAVLLGPIAISIAMIGESLNDGGRYPFLVLQGNTGVSPAEFMNMYLSLPTTLVYALVGTLLAFLGVFIATAYYALNKRFLADIPEQ
jgi:cytochrome d ubiquinol oxidase subunit I